MMGYEEDFFRLEKNVEKLLTNIERVQRENAVLQESLQKKEEENKELREEMLRVKGDKTDVHKRVTGLIDAIEKWENEYVAPDVESQAAGEESSESASDQGMVS